MTMTLTAFAAARAAASDCLSAEAAFYWPPPAKLCAPTEKPHCAGVRRLLSRPHPPRPSARDLGIDYYTMRRNYELQEAAYRERDAQYIARRINERCATETPAALRQTISDFLVQQGSFPPGTQTKNLGGGVGKGSYWFLTLEDLVSKSATASLLESVIHLLDLELKKSGG